MEEEAPKVKRRLVGKQDARTPEEKRLAAIKDEEERKRAIIEKVYYDDETGYRSIRETWKAAKALDKSIKEQDVKDWKARTEAQKKQVHGYNSFIASKPYEEFQIDLLFFTKEGEAEPRAEVAKIDEEAKPRKKYVPGLIMVDTFSKYCVIVILLEGKTTVSVATGLMEALTLMGCYKEGGRLPETIYSDNEPALTSKDMQKWFKDQGIRHLTTQGHAPVAERTIRTIKAINDARKKAPANSGRDWQEVLQGSVKAYNDVHAHRATEMTPQKARLPANTDAVKQNLEEKRVSTRKYPKLDVGDNVRLYHKKNALDKERIPLWSDVLYKVEEIVVSKRQKFYKINDGKEPKYMRHELLKIN